MALNTTIYAAIEAYQTTPNALGNPAFHINPAQKTIPLSSGNGNNQAQYLYAATRNLAASASENLDLAGSLLDEFGATLTFAHIKAIYIKAHSDNVNAVVVGGAASTPVIGGIFGAAGANLISLEPGASLLWVAPITGSVVTPSTGDLLKVLNGGSGTAINYDIIIVGV